MPLRLFWRRHRGHCILPVLRLINLGSREEVILYCARSGRRRRDRPHLQTLVRARAPLCRWDDLSVLHLGDRSLSLHIRRQRRRGRATYTRLGSGGGDGGEGGNWLWPWEGFSKGLVAGGRRTMLFLLLRLGLHFRPLHRAVDVRMREDAINSALVMDVRKPMAHSPLDFARSRRQLTMQELSAVRPSGAAPLPDCMRSPRTPPPARGPPRDRARSPQAARRHQLRTRVCCVLSFGVRAPPATDGRCRRRFAGRGPLLRQIAASYGCSVPPSCSADTQTVSPSPPREARPVGSVA